MATQEGGSTSGIDFSQDISGGRDLDHADLIDVLSNNVRAIMDSTGAAMRILDMNFNVVLENEMMKEMGGVAAEGVAEIDCYDQLCHSDVCGTDNCTLKQIVDEGRDEIRVEVEKESYDGRVVPTELVVRPIHDDDGAVVAISETFRDITDRKDATGSIKTAVDEVEAASHEVADASREISASAAEQLDSITQVDNEVSNLSATVEEIAATADEVNDISDRARDKARAGESDAETTIELMEQIERESGDATDDIQELHASIRRIDELVDVIDDIAEQTNLLALNASIEAARAGEAGEGFAVVADEVKSLAEESKGRAEEIEAIVDEVRTDTEHTVSSLEETNEIVQDGAEQVRASGETFKEIAEVVEDVSDGITEVAEATDDQAVSAEEIASMVDETATGFESVADRADTIAAANQDQVDRIERISTEVDQLNALDVQTDL